MNAGALAEIAARMTAELKLALRSLRRSPIFFGATVSSIGFGIGAVTAMFSLGYQVLIRDLPIRAPSRLVVLHASDMLPGRTLNDNFESVFSFPLYQRLRTEATADIEEFMARAGAPVNVQEDMGATRAQAEIVTGNFFHLLGLAPFAGRLLAPSDDTLPGANDVAVLGYDYWRGHFGGDAAAIGRTIVVNGHSFVISGIAPTGFRGILPGQTPDLYLPASMFSVVTPDFDGFQKANFHWMTILGRLAKGSSLQRSQAMLSALFTSIVRDQFGEQGLVSDTARKRAMAVRFDVRSASTGISSLQQQWKTPLLVLDFVTGGLFLVTCANLAGLVTARAAARRHELATRHAIGASRLQVATPLLAEMIIVSSLGGALGLVLSTGLSRFLLGILPDDVGLGWIEPSAGWPVALFAGTLSLFCCIGFGLVPVLRLTRAVTGENLGPRRSSRLIRWRKTLVALQVSVSVVILMAAGLFAKNLNSLLHRDPGFNAEHLLTFRIDPGVRGYKNVAAMNLYNEIRNRLAGLPGVTDVAISRWGPFSQTNAITNVSIDGYRPADGESMNSAINMTSHGFFHNLGIPVLMGREFTTADTLTSQKVIVVNEAFVKRFLRGRDPLGRSLTFGTYNPSRAVIVGVVRDAQLTSVRDKPKPFYFLAFSQWAEPSQPAAPAHFLVRSSNDDPTLPSAVRRILGDLDRGLPLVEIEKVANQLKRSIFQDRALATLTVASGFLALALASLGLYGVVAYTVSRRTGEIALRMALGASRASILFGTLREVALMAAAGGIAGLGVVLLLGHYLSSLLVDMQPADRDVLAGTVVLLLIVALAAGIGPAMRACQIAPAQALRHEA